MFFSQTEFSIFIIALMANLSLLLIVVNYAPKNPSRYLFSFFVLAQIFWIGTNYFSFQIKNSAGFLTITRLTLFFATFHALTFFLFIKNFLKREPDKSQILSKILIFFAIIISTLSLTSTFFSYPIINSSNGSLAPTTGKFIPLFGTYVGICVIAGFFYIISGYKKSQGTEKSQWQFLSAGLITTFILVLIFSFLNFAVLGNSTTVRFGHLYTLPFIVFTAYAMVKHRLLDIKAVVAELATLLLNLILIIQIANSNTTGQKLIGVIVLFGTIIVSILLVKGVKKEIKQRELLEVLTKKLEDANEKLKALDIARSEFITIASHQLRTPPATIKWYLSSVLAGDFGKLTAEQKNVVDKAFRTNNSQISLIDDMLNVSRIERGKMEFLFEKINLLPLAQITYEQLIPQATEHGLKLSLIEPTKPLPEIMADKEKIRQVMNNLIDNAIKYTKTGSVTAKLWEEGGNIKFSVTDTGKGIAPEEENSIFEKFSRGKESVKQSAGLGLGLYVAKIVIGQHKGKIWAESKGVGLGSSFIFSIPIKNNLSETTLLDLTQK